MHVDQPRKQSLVAKIDMFDTRTPADGARVSDAGDAPIGADEDRGIVDVLPVKHIDHARGGDDGLPAAILCLRRIVAAAKNAAPPKAIPRRKVPNFTLDCISAPPVVFTLAVMAKRELIGQRKIASGGNLVMREVMVESAAWTPPPAFLRRESDDLASKAARARGKGGRIVRDRFDHRGCLAPVVAIAHIVRECRIGVEIQRFGR